MKGHLDDAFYLAGGVLIVTACVMVSLPLGLAVAGLGLIVLARLGGY